MLPEPPVPIAASFNAPGPTIVVFSTFLTPGMFDPANWTVYHNFLRWRVIAAEVVPSYPNPIIHLTRGVNAFDLTPDSVRYTPPPFDITSRIGGIPAPAFVGFPLGP